MGGESAFASERSLLNGCAIQCVDIAYQVHVVHLLSAGILWVSKADSDLCGKENVYLGQILFWIKFFFLTFPCACVVSLLCLLVFLRHVVGRLLGIPVNIETLGIPLEPQGMNDEQLNALRRIPYGSLIQIMKEAARKRAKEKHTEQASNEPKRQSVLLLIAAFRKLGAINVF